MRKLRLRYYHPNFGFTLVELLTVVAIIAILAAIAIPSYLKYVRSARSSEALANLGAIQTYEESYFSEEDQYVSAGANPSTLPTKGERLPFNADMAGWADLGRIMPDGREVFFQYQITAGTANGSASYSPATITHGSASGCSNIGNSNFSTVNPGNLGIPDTANTFWFTATAIGDQTGDGKCSLFLAVTDRPDITVEKKIE